jgi:hypothetical protein
MPIPEHDAWIHLLPPRLIWFFAVTAFQASPSMRCVTSPVSGHLKHIHLRWSGRFTLPLLWPFVGGFGLPGPAPDYYGRC